MKRYIPVLLIAPAATAGTFSPPQGCTAYMTVQSANCQVEHHWTCAGDPAGDKWHGEVDQNGQLTYIGKVDDEAQWVDSFFAQTGRREMLVTPATDPASLTELFANGLDSYDFQIDTPTGVMTVKGFDRIAQRDVTIDGEPLHQTEYSIRITDAEGNLTYASEGSEYVSETHRRFFSGYGEVTGPDTPYRYQAKPVEFIYPGEKGYLENQARYGCDALSARFFVPLTD
ncbi:MAG: hypothetical protein AAF744_14325 [Pseudomonadota bacterium]